MLSSGATTIVRRMSHRTPVRCLLACILLLGCLSLFAAPAPAASRDRSGLPSRIGAYQSAAFSFEVTIKDDGEGEAGGWQEATARLVFTRPRPADNDGCSPGGTHQVWRCPLTVGMPVRTKQETISRSTAADRSADAATTAADAVTRGANENEADFCKRFRIKMQEILNKKNVGARVTPPR